MPPLTSDDVKELVSMLDDILDGPESGKRALVDVTNMKRKLCKWLIEKGCKPKGKWTKR